MVSFFANEYNFSSRAQPMKSSAYENTARSDAFASSSSERKKDNVKWTTACTACRQSFTRHIDLQRHMLSVHNDVRPFKCATCNRGFSFYSNLQRHEMCKHGIGMRTQQMKKAATCTICGKTLSSEPALKIHSVVHTREQPYECSFCGSRFSVKGNWRRHVRTVHKKHNATNTAVLPA